MNTEKTKGLFWFRRDLRLEDNTALFNALKECDLVAPIFVFDKDILNDLMSEDRRVEFIWETINSIKNSLIHLGSDLIVKYGSAVEDIPHLAEKYKVTAVYANEDYEPFGIQRDKKVKEALALKNIELKLYKDTVIFEKSEIIKSTNQPFVVFTQYKNEWKKKLLVQHYEPKESQSLLHKMVKFKGPEMPPLDYIGFQRTNLSQMKIGTGKEGADILFNRFKNKFIDNYKILRDIPYASGVSFLSVHNRFGTISIRKLVSETIDIMKYADPKKKENCDTWFNELIWREFYMQLLFHFPHLVNTPFKQEFKNYPWENNPINFLAWCEGKTGYPLVDAAMIQLNKTGYMHNRLRMLVASFLTKHLFTDYKLGEEYFATKLLDFDLSANNGGWQWAASTGCDSQEYFRIFNPIKQSEKFDPEARFIKKYLPMFENVPAKYIHEPWKYKNELKEFNVILGENYPMPIVNHEEQRKLILETYNKIIKGK